MSGKTLVLLALVVAAGYGLQRQSPPDIQQAGMATRLGFGVGKVGSKAIHGIVTDMVAGTEQSLTDMKGSIKRAKGGDGVRAKEFARRAASADSAAVDALYRGRPLHALQKAMDAKSMVNAVREQVQRSI